MLKVFWPDSCHIGPQLHRDIVSTKWRYLSCITHSNRLNPAKYRKLLFISYQYSGSHLSLTYSFSSYQNCFKIEIPDFLICPLILYVVRCKILLPKISKALELKKHFTINVKQVTQILDAVFKKKSGRLCRFLKGFLQREKLLNVKRILNCSFKNHLWGDFFTCHGDS